MKLGFLPVGALKIGISSSFFTVVIFFKETWDEKLGFEPITFFGSSTTLEFKLFKPDFILGLL